MHCFKQKNLFIAHFYSTTFAYGIQWFSICQKKNDATTFKSCEIWLISLPFMISRKKKNETVENLCDA